VLIAAQTSRPSLLHGELGVGMNVRVKRLEIGKQAAKLCECGIGRLLMSAGSWDPLVIV